MATVYITILVAVMLVQVSGVVDSMIRTNGQYQELGRATQARYAAESLVGFAQAEVLEGSNIYPLGY